MMAAEAAGVAGADSMVEEEAVVDIIGIDGVVVVVVTLIQAADIVAIDIIGGEEGDTRCMFVARQIHRGSYVAMSLAYV